MLLKGLCDAVTYTDPAEAPARFKCREYGLVLFDYLMPRMNGFEFYHAIKRMDPDINICMITALEEPFASEQMFAKFREIMNDRH